LGRSLLGKFRLAPSPLAPRIVNWDLTYACPLRCGHCYSESGRRASRQLPLNDLLRIADVLGQIRPLPRVSFSGGEPLLVKGFLDVAGRLRHHGVGVSLYTSGYRLSPSVAEGIARTFERIAVSVDGADPAVNDFLRERAGAFDEAIGALELFDGIARKSQAERRPAPHFGIEVTVMKTNFHQLERFCTELAPRFAHLKYIALGALIPTGFGSRESFVERELLADDQVAELARAGPRLRALAPPGVHVRTATNLPFLMHPEQIRRGVALDDIMKIEADGRVRGMDIYEGTVGNLLEEPLETVWKRTLSRHRDPFVMRELSAVRTMRDWAAACRRIDLHFAAPDDRDRILARPEAASVPSGLRPTGGPTSKRSLDLLSRT
jgi:MoaA/NifB/PqqE/SkfB family radical SAM enzyme